MFIIDWLIICTSSPNITRLGYLREHVIADSPETGDQDDDANENT